MEAYIMVIINNKMVSLYIQLTNLQIIIIYKKTHKHVMVNFK